LFDSSYCIKHYWQNGGKPNLCGGEAFTMQEFDFQLFINALLSTDFGISFNTMSPNGRFLLHDLVSGRRAIFKTLITYFPKSQVFLLHKLAKKYVKKRAKFPVVIYDQYFNTTEMTTWSFINFQTVQYHVQQLQKTTRVVN